MSNNKALLISVFLILVAVINSEAFRVPRPNTFILPWSQEQMKQHNEAHEDLWNLQNGEFNFDIVTTSKSNASNGDVWFIQTGSVVYLQYKANDQIFTITPDGA